MAYQIPQKLEYKEKIMFGLTFKQLFYVFIFGLFILVSFRSGFNEIIKWALTLFFVVIAIFFVFFDLNKILANLWVYLHFRKANLNEAKMRRYLGLKKVDNGVITVTRSTVETNLTILQVEPINYSIKNEKEQEAIIAGFQKFLNSVDFPIQFLINTVNLNIDKYMDYLRENIKKKYEDIFLDFRKHINSLTKETNLKNRFFYVIVPESNRNLEVQTNLVIEGLKGLGLKVKQLKDKQLLIMLYNYFNDTIINENREASAEQINQGKTHYLTAPQQIINSPNNIQVNKKYCRIISADGYPRMVESGFLDKIISSNSDYDISIHLTPHPIELSMINLNKELQKQAADLHAAQIKGQLNPSLEIQYKDTHTVLENLQKGKEKLFNVSMYINCKSLDKDKLDLVTKKAESELNSIMVIPQPAYFRMAQGYKSMMPFAHNALDIKRNITTKALSAFYPFTSPFLTLEQRGVFLGLNKNKIPIIKDIFSLTNANGTILATSGSGKSYFSKLLISRQLLSGTNVMIIDPQAEYIELTRKYKGQIVTISKDSETIINPLDLMGHDYGEKRLSLMDLFKVMFGSLTEIQKAILDRALNETYAKKGINGKRFEGKKPPRLSDLYGQLVRMDRKASAMEKITYRALINRLSMYIKGGVFGFLDKHTKIDFKSDLVCFNIGNMPKQVKPVVMYLILDYVYMKMKKNKKRKLLVIDEAWSLLGRTEGESYIFEIVKTCRKFNLGLLMITQDVGDLVGSKAGKAVLSNSSYSLLLRQKPSIIDSVTSTFHLSEYEKNHLLTANIGRGLLILENDHEEIEVIASPKEHEIISTNPNEAKENNEESKKVKEKDVTIDLDLDKGIYLANKLNDEEKNYLFNRGYEVGDFVGINKTRGERYLVKTMRGSLMHSFLVYAVANEIRKKTKKVELFETKKPDIIFKARGKEIALEIETGTNFKKHKKRLAKKVEALNKEYKKRWFFVLTSTDYKKQYSKFGKVLLRKDINRFVRACFRR